MAKGLYLKETWGKGRLGTVDFGKELDFCSKFNEKKLKIFKNYLFKKTFLLKKFF